MLDIFSPVITRFPVNIGVYMVLQFLVSLCMAWLFGAMAYFTVLRGHNTFTAFGKMAIVCLGTAALTQNYLSCLLVIILTGVSYGVIAAGNRVWDFRKCSISAYSTGFISWFAWTLGEDTGFHLLIAAAFSVGLSLAVFAVAHYLENYVTAIAWVLPAVVGGVFFCGLAMYAFGEITRGKWPVPLAGIAVLGLEILAALLQGLRERRRDVGMF